jgi:hypothetical protein
LVVLGLLRWLFSMIRVTPPYFFTTWKFSNSCLKRYIVGVLWPDGQCRKTPRIQRGSYPKAPKEQDV